MGLNTVLLINFVQFTITVTITITKCPVIIITNTYYYYQCCIDTDFYRYYK